MIAAGRICLVFLYVFLFNSVIAQNQSIRYLGINQGLSNNSVRSIYQDRNGFMWFGTYDGLNRYDGYSFKVFRNKPGDTASLSHNYINTISEDLHGNLFVGTGQGVSVYNNLTTQFSTGLYIPFDSSRPVKIPFNISVVKSDSKGNVYIGTSNGGLLIKKQTDDNAIQPGCIRNMQGDCRYNIEAITIDSKQRIWLTVGNAGLYIYDPAAQKATLVKSHSLVVRCMEADKLGNLWIGTKDGLYLYNPVSRSIANFKDLQTGKLSSNSVFSLSLDQHDKLWIGTEGGGINIYDVKRGTISYLMPDDKQGNLSGETIYSIYQDKEERKWIGTHKGGLNIIDPRKTIFQTIARDPLNANSLVNNFISSFYSDNNNNLWIGSDGGGISVWNRQANVFNNYRHNAENPQSLSHNAVPSIVQDYLGNIWIATFGNGINKFNKTTQTFEHYQCINSQTGAENNYVWRLYEDRQRNFWATTYADGRLYKLNRQTNLFEMFNPGFVDFYTLLEDNRGNFWGGSFNGLHKIDRQQKSYQLYRINKPVRAIHQDKKGQLWLGTEGLGLILFDPAKGEVRISYNETNGLCNNSVLNILEDDKGNLWLSTFHGLSKFDPQAQKFTNFYQEDGLQSNQFEFNAALRLPTGEMLFGGIGGFTIFNPDSLNPQINMPTLFLTSIRVNNQLVTAGSVYVSKTDGNRFQKLRVPYNDAVFSFDFAALEYSSPGKINYAYYLEGWDKNWNYTNNIRTANYTNVNEGDYTLHIKATNAAGVWNTQQVRLQIIVLPPWYRSWWAYLLYVAMVAYIIYLYNGYRVRKAKLMYEVKLAHLQSEKEWELAQMEIQKEKELAQAAILSEKELNEKKLAFFTDVSHEFRTPLALIIGPLKDYLGNGKPEDKKSLNGVYRNARRLLTLVDQLLHFRKAGADADSLRLVKLNFSHLCREVFASFETVAISKKLDYRLNCDSDAIELIADREKLEVILYNLLSNAVKFTSDGGQIEMRVMEKERTVEVKLTDNGQGIPPEVGNRLFERFQRVEENGVPSKPGFGIGLYLVKHFVERHHGEITYTSNLGTGTTFCISFKKGKAHFGDLPIYEDKAPVEIPLLNEPGEAPLEEVQTNGLEELVSSQKAILIVEDNDEMREYISGIFAGNFIVYTAASGNQGIEAANKYLPDIIISDIMMDNGNGIELCSAIKNNPALGHIPIILLTAVSDADIRLKGTESGADDYMSKPFEKELLVARVNTLLKNRTKLQQYFYNEVTLKKQDFKISAEYKEFLESCIAIVERHLTDDQFNIKKMAQEIGMSHTVLYRRIKSMSGQSIAGFVRFIRLRKAAELMINTHDNVTAIALEVGFKEVKYFRKQFNAQFGINPSEYIKKYRQPFTPTFTIKG